MLVSGVGMLAVGVGAVAWWRRRAQAGIWFGLGALAWAASVALKLGWAIPTHKLVEDALTRLFGPTLAAPIFWIYIGALTGLFECGFTRFLVSRTRLVRADWRQAIAFGIGFGAIEAALLGLVVIIWVLVTPAALQSSALQAARGGAAWLLLPIVERVIAIAIHVYSSVLVLHAVRAGQRRCFWLAFAYKSAVDAIAAAAVLGWKAPDSPARHLALEAIMAGFAVGALVGLSRLKRRY
jgi:uncharacterized membrane protein YhfC